MPTVASKRSLNVAEPEIRFRLPQTWYASIAAKAKRVQMPISRYARLAFLVNVGDFDKEITRVSNKASKKKLGKTDIEKAIASARSA